MEGNNCNQSTHIENKLGVSFSIRNKKNRGQVGRGITAIKAHTIIIIIAHIQETSNQETEIKQFHVNLLLKLNSNATGYFKIKTVIIRNNVKINKIYALKCGFITCLIRERKAHTRCIGSLRRFSINNNTKRLPRENVQRKREDRKVRERLREDGGGRTLKECRWRKTMRRDRTRNVNR